MMTTIASSKRIARMAARSVAIAVVSVTAVLAAAERAAAHDHGALRLVSKTFRAGDSLMIGGV